MGTYPSYKIFKGLQKPLEFIGLKGRYVFVGLGAAISAILTFVAMFIAFGLVTALIATLLLLATVAIWIYKKQNKGLHDKQCDKGIFIVNQIIISKQEYKK